MENPLFQAVAIKELRALLEKLGISELNIEVRAGRLGLGESFVLSMSVDKEDSRLLIGQHGLTLAALQYLLHALVRRVAPDSSGFSIDINEYWVQKKALLEKDAEEAVQRVLLSGQPVPLRAMSSYERKIVHLIFSHHTKVRAASVGKGEERKIVVSPAEPPIIND